MTLFLIELLQRVLGFLFVFIFTAVTTVQIYTLCNYYLTNAQMLKTEHRRLSHLTPQLFGRGPKRLSVLPRVLA